MKSDYKAERWGADANDMKWSKTRKRSKVKSPGVRNPANKIFIRCMKGNGLLRPTAALVAKAKTRWLLNPKSQSFYWSGMVYSQDQVKPNDQIRFFGSANGFCISAHCVIPARGLWEIYLNLKA